MSKSSPRGCLFVNDSPAAISEKIKRATTDSENSIGYAPEKRPGISNLITIYAELVEALPNEVVKKYKGKGYADFKTALAKLVAEKLSMFREKRVNAARAGKIFASGTTKARRIAEKTLKETKQKVGLL